MPNKDGVSQEDIKWILKIRFREVKVKMNLQGLYDSFECEMCKEEVETQEKNEIWKLIKHGEKIYE